MLGFTGIYLFLFITLTSVPLRALPVFKRPRAVSFAADPRIDVAMILDAAKNGKDVLATFGHGGDSGSKVEIFGDWLNLMDGGPAIHFTADMDVDCDGTDFKCKDNPDGQSLTSFGQLDASEVPFFVIPESFYQDHKSEIKPNSLGTIICGGKMFYGIFGDSNRDRPEVIGEASILMAQTCFPDEGLGGNKGHSQLDVLYILFGNQVPEGVGETTIDIAALKALGDEQAIRLVEALKDSSWMSAALAQ